MKKILLLSSVFISIISCNNKQQTKSFYPSQGDDDLNKYFSRLYDPEKNEIMYIKNPTNFGGFSSDPFVYILNLDSYKWRIKMIHEDTTLQE